MDDILELFLPLPKPKLPGRGARQPAVRYQVASNGWFRRGCIHAIPTLRIPGVPLLEDSGPSASQVCKEKKKEALRRVSDKGMVTVGARCDAHHPIILNN